MVRAIWDTSSVWVRRVRYSSPSGIEKYLGLMLQPSECVGVNNAVTVHLEGRSDGAGGFRPFPAPGLGALAAERRHEIFFAFFKLLADIHGVPVVIS